MTFVSHPVKDFSLRWWAYLKFPSGIEEADGMLTVTVTDWNDRPVPSATLELFGRMSQIRDGAAEFPYADFAAGKHAKSVWLHRKGCDPVPGALTFI